jgi:hypothetical protein
LSVDISNAIRCPRWPRRVVPVSPSKPITNGQCVNSAQRPTDCVVTVSVHSVKQCSNTLQFQRRFCAMPSGTVPHWASGMVWTHPPPPLHAHLARLVCPTERQITIIHNMKGNEAFKKRMTKFLVDMCQTRWNSHSRTTSTTLVETNSSGAWGRCASDAPIVLSSVRLLQCSVSVSPRKLFSRRDSRSRCPATVSRD